MTFDSIQEALKTTPFRPFHLRMSDGRAYDITHPELVWVVPTRQRTAVVALPRGGAAVIDLLHITSLEIINTEDGEGRRAG